MRKSSSTSSSDRDEGTQQSSKINRWQVGRIFLFGASLLLVGEAYARLASWYWDDPRYVHQPLTFHRIHQSKEEYSGIKEAIDVRIDHMGLRSTDHSTGRDVEVLTLGSSTVFCGRLDQDDTFSEQIAAQLRRKISRNIVTGSAAAPGLLAWHHARHAKQLLPRLKSVRCVVAMPGVADMNRWLRGSGTEVTESMKRHLYWGRLWPGDPGPGTSLRATRRIRDLVRQEGGSLLVSLGVRKEQVSNGSPGQRDRLRGFRQAAPPVPLPEDRRDALPEALQFYQDCLRSLCEACLGQDVELVLVTQPILYGPHLTEAGRSLWWSGNLGEKSATTRYVDEPTYAWCLEQFNRITEEVSREFRLPLVDLARTMQDEEGKFFHDTVHFNERGAELAGEVVGDEVAASVCFDPLLSDLFAEPILYRSSIDPELGQLSAKVYYRRSFQGQPKPILVCLHGFSGNAADVSDIARAARADGYFVVVPDLRGRGESDGSPDYGGIETQDIRDAVTAVVEGYGDLVRSDRVVIEGFSGGGGNVLSALTKFPDSWSAGLSFFGISDYGFHQDWGWYQASAGHRRQALLSVIGDPRTEEGREAYGSRASVLGAGNNHRARIHLFTDVGDTVCLSEQSERFAWAARDAGLNNVFLHKSTDGRWGHRIPRWHELFAAHRLAGLESLPSPTPSAAGSRTYTVVGFCETDGFRCWLGSGADARATLSHVQGEDGHDFDLRFLSRETKVRLSVVVSEEDVSYQVKINGKLENPVHPIDGRVHLPIFQGSARIEIRSG